MQVVVVNLVQVASYHWECDVGSHSAAVRHCAAGSCSAAENDLLESRRQIDAVDHLLDLGIAEDHFACKAVQVNMAGVDKETDFGMAVVRIQAEVLDRVLAGMVAADMVAEM